MGKHELHSLSNNSDPQTNKSPRINHHMDQSDDHIISSSEEHNRKKMLGLQDLSQDLLEEILWRVPLKSRTKLKPLAKSLTTSITSLRISMPLTTCLGLVVFLTNKVKHSSTFIQLRDQAFVQTASVHSSLYHTFPFLIDSCNGLLLYGTHDHVSWTYHVARSDSNHVVALPPAHSISTLVYTSLLVDSSDKFKIMCLFLNQVDCVTEKVQGVVFDSKNWKWMEYESRIVNSHLIRRDCFIKGKCFRPSVYSGKRLYCVCLLIYDDEKGFFKLIQLPEDPMVSKSVRNNNADHCYQLLWESEGKLHFCAPDANNQMFCIWAYENDDDNDFMDHKSMWRLKQSVKLKDSLISQKRIQPVAFNEDLQRLYMFVKQSGVIASYSFETQKFEKVWSLGEAGHNYLMSTIFTFLLGSTSQMEYNR